MKTQTNKARGGIPERIPLSLEDFKMFTGMTGRELSEFLEISIHYTWKLLWRKSIPHPNMALRISHLTEIPIMNLLYPDMEK